VLAKRLEPDATMDADKIYAKIVPGLQSKPTLGEKTLASLLSEQEKKMSVYWDGLDPFADLRMGWRASIARHLFHILPGQRILEIGGGIGRFSQALVKATRDECHVTVAVFSSGYKETIKGLVNSENVDIKYLDSFPGLLRGEKFDYVIAQNMLVDRTRNDFLNTVKSLIKPGGGLLLFESNPWNPYYRFRRLLRRIIPVAWKRPAESTSLDRFQVFSVLTEIGYVQISAVPYDFLYAPVPRFLLWPAQHASIILENFPYLRNFAGSLYIWARNPAQENYCEPTVDLCEHPMFFGKVSFVIPCHNEEMNLPGLIKYIKDFYGRYIFEIIIVDDNSTDATSDLAMRLSNEDKRVHLLKRSPPNGVGRALRDGLRQAEGEYILTMDADFKHIIPEMRDLFDALEEGADVAVGSRFSRKSVLINYPFVKIIYNRVFHILANFIFGRHFRDISNNLKIFRKEVAKKIVIESDDFAANVETGLKPILLGYKVVEVPISWINRTVGMGSSTFNIIKTGPNYLKLLLKLSWRRLTGKIGKRDAKGKTG